MSFLCENFSFSSSLFTKFFPGIVNNTFNKFFSPPGRFCVRGKQERALSDEKKKKKRAHRTKVTSSSSSSSSHP